MMLDIVAILADAAPSVVDVVETAVSTSDVVLSESAAAVEAISKEVAEVSSSQTELSEEFVASIPTEAAAESSKLQGLAKRFGIDGRILLAQVVNFALVAFLLWRFAFKPVVKTLDERQKAIADGLQYAEEAKDKLAETEKKQGDILRNAQSEAQNVIAKAQDAAKALVEKSSKEASAKAELILKKAEESITQEREQMVNEVRKEMQALVVQATAATLRKQLTDEEKQRFNEEAAKSLAALN